MISSKIKTLTVYDVADESIREETTTGNTAVRMGTGCPLGVQRVEERSCHESPGPDHGRRSHEDPLANTTHREAN